MRNIRRNFISECGKLILYYSELNISSQIDDLVYFKTWSCVPKKSIFVYE